MMIIGKADNAVRDWLGNKVRFADLFNGIVYEGEAVIKPEELTQTNNETGMVVKYKEGKEKAVNRRRDIIMNWKGGYNLVVLAIESQKEISYAMPVRNMLYDALAYTDQMKAIWNDIPENERPKKYTDEFFSRFRKTDRLYPVVTLVLYYGGSGDWDGNKSLYEMFGENISEEQKKMMNKYVADYKINLVDLQKIKDIGVFKSDLRQAIGMLQCKESGDRLAEYVEKNKEELSSLDAETRRVIRDVMNVTDLEKYVRKENGKEVVDVCKAIEEIREKGKMEGKIEGKIEGRIEGETKLLIKQVARKIKLGKTLEVIVSDLDDTQDNIGPIYEAVMEAGVDSGVDEIYKIWERNVEK